jgi:hypothetical protein
MATFFKLHFFYEICDFFSDNMASTELSMSTLTRLHTPNMSGTLFVDADARLACSISSVNTNQ